jgi:DNA-binding XRE family transcriptional regulator
LERAQQGLLSGVDEGNHPPAKPGDGYFIELDGKREFAVIPIELYERLSVALEDADDAALFDSVRAADDGFRIPAAVAHALLDGEQPVKVWREQRGLTQDALAAKAGISKGYLCQIEMCKRVGALKTLRAIANALAISVPDLTTA